MSERVAGPGVRPEGRAGCLGGGFGRPWVLVAAMFAPVVLGGALLVASLAADVRRSAGAARADAGLVSVEPLRGSGSAFGPVAVYGGRVVEQAARKAGGKQGRRARGDRVVPVVPARDARGGVEASAAGGRAKARLTEAVLLRPVRRSGGGGERAGADCPPEEKAVRAKAPDENVVGAKAPDEKVERVEAPEEVERPSRVVSDLGLGIVTTEVG